MAKNSISDWDTDASANTDIAGINIAEGCPPANLNNAVRAVMAQVKVAIGSATSYIAAVTGNLLTADGVWSAAAEKTLADAALITPDMSTFLNATVTLGGNRILGGPSNAKVGQSGCIRIVQDGTGGRTLAFASEWKFAGGVTPSLSTGANKTDLLFYQVIAPGLVYAALVKAVV